jgi:hypothetical protein
VPDDAFIFDEERLRGFMPYPESLGDCIRYCAVFNDEYGAKNQLAKAFGEVRKLFVRLGADGTLRAMLENNYGIGLRPIQQLFEISILSYV